MLPKKNVYRGREIVHYDYLMGLREGMIADFFKNHPNFTGQDDWGAGNLNKPGGWGMTVFRYNHVNEKEDMSAYRGSLAKQEEEIAIKYPYVYENIIKKFGDDCHCAAFLVLHPGAILYRHTGDENREAKFIRIHIPLIIPKGDLGMEIHSEEVNWDDLFAFDNQKIHSAWNLSDEPRLIFLVDLRRSICDMPDGDPWDFERDELNAPPFPKLYGDKTGVTWGPTEK